MLNNKIMIISFTSVLSALLCVNAYASGAEIIYRHSITSAGGAIGGGTTEPEIPTPSAGTILAPTINTLTAGSYMTPATFTLSDDTVIANSWIMNPIPPGLSFSSAGTLTGTPSSVGNYTVNVSVNGTNGAASTSIPINITGQNNANNVSVSMSIGETVPPSVNAEIINSQNGDSISNATIVSGNLPNGLTLSGNGQLSGTVASNAQATTYLAQVQLNNQYNVQKTVQYSITLTSPLSVNAPTNTQVAYIGDNISLNFNSDVSGGTGAYQWTPNSLPPSAVLSSGGSFTWNPTSASTLTTVSATVKDDTQSQPYSRKFQVFDKLISDHTTVIFGSISVNNMGGDIIYLKIVGGAFPYATPQFTGDTHRVKATIEYSFETDFDDKQGFQYIINIKPVSPSVAAGFFNLNLIFKDANNKTLIIPLEGELAREVGSL